MFPYVSLSLFVHEINKIPQAFQFDQKSVGGHLGRPGADPDATRGRFLGENSAKILVISCDDLFFVTILDIHDCESRTNAQAMSALRINESASQT